MNGSWRRAARVLWLRRHWRPSKVGNVGACSQWTAIEERISAHEVGLPAMCCDRAWAACGRDGRGGMHVACWRLAMREQSRAVRLLCMVHMRLDWCGHLLRPRLHPLRGPLSERQSMCCASASASAACKRRPANMQSPLCLSETKMSGTFTSLTWHAVSETPCTGRR